MAAPNIVGVTTMDDGNEQRGREIMVPDPKPMWVDDEQARN